VRRAFPLSAPEQYVGFCDIEGKTIALVRSPTELEVESRQLTEEELRKSYLVSVIRHLEKVQEQRGVTQWMVESDRGPRAFVVRDLPEHLTELGNGRLQFTDLHGNRYELAPAELDAASQRRLAQVL